MRPLHLIRFAFAVGFVSILFSCGNQKEISWNANDYKLTKASLQEFVSGEEGGQGKTILTIEIEALNQTEQRVDSLEYKGKMYPLKGEKLVYDINLNFGNTIAGGGDTTITQSQAIIYYQSNDKRYKLLVDSIETKDPIYLP